MHNQGNISGCRTFESKLISGKRAQFQFFFHEIVNSFSKVPLLPIKYLCNCNKIWSIIEVFVALCLYDFRFIKFRARFRILMNKVKNYFVNFKCQQLKKLNSGPEILYQKIQQKIVFYLFLFLCQMFCHSKT